MARVARVGDRRLGEPDPDGHAAQEAVALGYREDRVERLAVHQPEVAGVLLQVEPRYPREEAIEPARRRQLEPGLPGAVVPHPVDHVRALAPVLEHFRDQLRRILEVAVNHHDRIPARVLKTCGYRRLMAEVPRKVEHAHARIRVGQLIE